MTGLIISKYQNFMKKLRTLTFSAVFIILAILVFGQFATNRLSKVGPATSSPIPLEMHEEEQSVTLVVDFSDGNVHRFSKDWSDGDTAYSLLQEYAESREVEFSKTQYDFGVFVESIDGKESTQDMAWIYFVNGTSGDVAADKFELNSGDQVEWKYIKPEPSI